MSTPSSSPKGYPSLAFDCIILQHLDGEANHRNLLVGRILFVTEMQTVSRVFSVAIDYSPVNIDQFCQFELLY